MRCFVAAFVEADSARRLQNAYRAWSDSADRLPRRVRPVPPENYHITLKFLGELGTSAVSSVLDAVADLEGNGTSGTVSGFHGFPRPAAARMVVAELTAHEALAGWWSRLEGIFGTEGRPFRPHVTVARFARPRLIRPAALEHPLVLELTSPRLYRSDTSPQGPRYRPVAAADLNPRS